MTTTTIATTTSTTADTPIIVPVESLTAAIHVQPYRQQRQQAGVPAIPEPATSNDDELEGWAKVLGQTLLTYPLPFA